MQGVVFTGDRELEIRQFEDPTPGPGEVVLEMRASGMCGSDLHAYRASRDGGGIAAALGLGKDPGPVIAGHEPCGVVVARGPGVTEAQAPDGARVMNHHYAGCGACEHCRVGWSQLCGDGFVVYGVTGHGGHADYLKVPVRTLVPLPEALSFESGAAISCGTGTAWGALNRLDVSGRDTLAVFGQGPVGLSATLLGAAMGARVVAIDTSPERLALAKQFHADEVINPLDEDPVDKLKALTFGRGVDKSLDCTGHPEARAQVVRSTRTWGSACFVGEGGEVTLKVSQDMIRRQLTLHASWTFSAIGQAECARFVAEKGIDLDQIFTHQYQLDQAEEAYKLFDTQTTGKGVFVRN